ncbi:MAG: hypothetical protein RL563_1860 [Pseudomonadota bacterium]
MLTNASNSHPNFSDIERHYQTLLDSLTEVVFSLNDEGCFIILNQAWQNLTGFDATQMLGKPFRDCLAEQDCQVFFSDPTINHIDDFCTVFSDKGNPISCLLSARRTLSGWQGTLKSVATELTETSLEPYRVIVDSAAEILLQLDNDMRIRFINPAWQEITGISTSLAIGQCLIDFIDDDDKTQFRNAWKENILVNQCYRQEFRLNCSDNTCHWMSMQARTAQLNNGDSIVIGAMIDISHRKQMEESLRRSEERYALLASSTTDGIWDWDLASDQVYFSPRWKEMIGYQDHELASHFSSWYERVHPDDIQQAMDDINDCLESRKPLYENIHRLQHRDGSWRWILDRGIMLRDIEGKAYRMVGSHADITLLKKTEEALLQRENELNAIVSISPDGIVTIAENSVIQSANPAFVNMTGFDIQKLIGLSEKAFEQALHDLSDSNPRYKARHQANTQIYAIDLVKLRNHPLHNHPVQLDQSTRAHNPKWRVLSRTERALHHYGIAKVLYFRDISTETEVDQMKSQFLSTAAHELRTPMASVFGFSELLLSREFDSTVRHEILSTIHQQSESLVNMLTQLLDLARIESRMGLDFSFVRQPLLPIVERAMSELLIPGDQRKIKFTKPKSTFQVEVDADKLRQVISNVLVNAYKYSPKGGDIRLSIKQRKLSNGNSEVGIIITDKGLGMNNEQLANIYDRFWRADNSGGIPGTGLGMSLVKEIMDIHQGEVAIESKPGQGTCVSLWLRQHPTASD